ncbi:hypothetical protein PIB30_020087 [Stylosanthes scabra]|uniref:Uncharacterized protein n=1 Tax=Stylosanthes scabra TaxID=79078 RepID=A0ABU6V7F6_9FABA|nr:hypothetical protein [Stylosanthes scabra]
MKEYMEKQKQDFTTANQYWARVNSNNEEKIDYLCWGVQQINPYLTARLPEDILEWMRNNVRAWKGHFSGGMNTQPRNCWPGATSATKAEDDKGNGKEKAEEGDVDGHGKKKA